MVNAAPDSMVAKSYAFDRAAKRNDLPFVRTFRVPKSVADRNMKTLYKGTGDYTGKGYKSTILTPQQANKYDITQKVDTSGVLDTKLSLNKSQRQELSQRVRRALRNPKAQEVMRRDIKQGNDASLTNIYRNVRQNPQNPNTLENELRGRYRGKAIHNSTEITDLQTKGRSSLPLYGQQRRELQQRVRRALRNPRNREVLNREVRQGNEDSLTNIYRNVRQNPQNPNTLENELRGRYRGKGVGRKEATNEQLAPIGKSNQLPGKYSKVVITTDTPADRMNELKRRVKRYGKGLQRMSDIYPNYP